MEIRFINNNEFDEIIGGNVIKSRAYVYTNLRF